MQFEKFHKQMSTVDVLDHYKLYPYYSFWKAVIFDTKYVKFVTMFNTCLLSRQDQYEYLVMVSNLFIPSGASDTQICADFYLYKSI